MTKKTLSGRITDRHTRESFGALLRGETERVLKRRAVYAFFIGLAVATGAHWLAWAVLR